MVIICWQNVEDKKQIEPGDEGYHGHNRMVTGPLSSEAMMQREQSKRHVTFIGVTKDMVADEERQREESVLVGVSPKFHVRDTWHTRSYNGIRRRTFGRCLAQEASIFMKELMYV